MARLRKMGRLVAWTLAAILALLALLVAIALWEVHRSVPTLDGQARVPGLQATVAIRRDALGIAVVQGANRLDVARGLGFVHAQERFFEMDLTRRSAAGELSALFGAVALDRDKARRLHRLRTTLDARLQQLAPNERALLQAYADGVNAGLAQLGTRPWQYLLLQADPAPWRPTDSLLVIAEMFWKLQGDSVDAGLDRALLNDKAGALVFEWLEPGGGRWDGTLDGSVERAPVMPTADLLDPRRGSLRGANAPGADARPAQQDPREALWAASVAALDAREPQGPPIGSNNWAVDGTRSVSGDAMLANDMHLGLTAPSLWFRAQLEIGTGATALRAAGVTLPGLPAIVVGSNGSVAWGFTNAYGQWFDWVQVPPHANSKLSHVSEHIEVKGAAPVTLDVASYDGQPVAKVVDGKSYALTWAADLGSSYNLALDELLQAHDVVAALQVAQRAGMPHQNMLVADNGGHIAWTIAGLLWTDPRLGHFGRLGPFPRGGARPWADAPIALNPPDGQLWTANARQVGRDDEPALPACRSLAPAQREACTATTTAAQPRPGWTPGAAPRAEAWLQPGAGGLPFQHRGAPIGDGGFDLGARAQQIRDRLSATPKFDESSLGAIQFDDEARFLQPWAGRIAAVVASPTARPEVTALLKAWNGRADADQAGYRFVRSVRLRVFDALWLAWTRPILGERQADAKRRMNWHAMFEYTVEQALDQRPEHLLPQPFATWDAFLLAQVDATVAELTRNGQRSLAAATWGEANRSEIRNVLSRAVPALSRFLDMPSLAQSGDNNMPRVASPSFGQSERLVVAPGHEERATLSMPGGQSGHPMSPYYGAGHDAWAAGRTSPLLAGAAEHTLTLTP